MVETPCADTDVMVKIPHVGVRTCYVTHPPVVPVPDGRVPVPGVRKGEVGKGGEAIFGAEGE